MTTRARLHGEIYPPLTPREVDVIAAYVETASMKDAGEKLGISRNTVKERLRRARRRFDVEKTLDLLRAIGWLRVPRR
jgi:DNA-binding NarL/FixJ family response regulator